MNLNLLDAEEVLMEDYILEYKKGMDFFSNELIWLNVNMYIINQIRNFPLGLFCHQYDMIFFSMVLSNFFDTSILIITRLVKDTGEDLYTLLRFKNNLIQHIKPDYKSYFAKRLKEVKFDAKIDNMLKKAKKLRDVRIAHLIKDSIFNVEKVVSFDFDELENLCNALNSLFNVLAFNVEYDMLPIPYSNKFKQNLGTDYKTDLEKILDSIVENSNLINLPENQPELWERRKARMPDDQIKLFNSYRKNFDLPEV
ncbi:hypothetical protein KAW18_05160 [candidate division WOR-3 bacterium]|nr:hypothetical protein [candidate division WOR-3 bacterium]